MAPETQNSIRKFHQSSIESFPHDNQFPLFKFFSQFEAEGGAQSVARWLKKTGSATSSIFNEDSQSKVSKKVCPLDSFREKS